MPGQVHPAAVRHSSARRIDLIATVPAALLALMAAGIPLFVWEPLRDQIVLPRLAATAALTGLALTTWAAINQCPNWSRHIALPAGTAGLIVILSAISAYLGVDPMGSMLGEYQRYQGLLPLAMDVLLMLAVMLVIAVARRRSMLFIIWGAFVGGVLAAGYAVVQRMGLDWVQWTGVDPRRTGGAFAQPDALGVELVVVLPLAVGLWGESTGWRRELVALGVAVMGAGLLFTESRGAWVGAAASLIVLIALRVRRATWKAASFSLLAALAIVGVLLVSSSPGRGVLRQSIERARSSTNLADVSVSTRLGLWKTSLEMIADHPIIGSGPDSFSTLFASYRTADQPGVGTANVRPESSHNFFLDQGVATGALGFMAWCLLIGSTLWAGLRALRSQRVLVAGCVAGLVGYYVAVSFAFAEAMTGWLPWFVMGALLGIGWINDPEAAVKHDRATQLAMVARFALGGCGLLLILGGGVLFVSDLAAGRAVAAAQRGAPDVAVDRARIAYRLNPLQGAYLLDRGSYEELAATTEGQRQWSAAAASYRLFNRRFEPSAYSLVAEARARAALGPQDDNPSETARLLNEAARADPYNEEVNAAIARLRESLRNDGFP